MPATGSRDLIAVGALKMKPKTWEQLFSYHAVSLLQLYFVCLTQMQCDFFCFFFHFKLDEGWGIFVVCFSRVSSIL